jgi:hypothetical protein
VSAFPFCFVIHSCGSFIAGYLRKLGTWTQKRNRYLNAGHSEGNPRKVFLIPRLLSKGHRGVKYASLKLVETESAVPADSAAKSKISP